MLPACIDDVIFTKPSQREYLRHIVTGEVRFPNSHKRGFLLHGGNGSGKTTLAHLLPVLLEYQLATDDAKNAFDWQYDYAGETVSITRANGGKPSANAVSLQYRNCGESHNNASSAVMQELRKATAVNLSAISEGANLNHFVLDELDCWATASQAKLKGLITHCTDWSVFYITTNHLNKIEKGIRSRCIEIELNGGAEAEYLPLIRRQYPQLAGYDDSQLARVVTAAGGDWRDLHDALTRLVCSTGARANRAA